jgi:hypothetical protein
VADILYISCHSVLEYDELRLLTSLGHRIFSCGSYFNPESPGESIRPPLKLHQDPEWMEIFKRTDCGGIPLRLSREFLSKFDYIIAMHGHDFIFNNLKNFSKKNTIFWRGIGQSNTIIESRLKILKKNKIQIIRYSPMESRTKGFAGEDHIIRFYKKELDFKPSEERIHDGFLCYNAILQRQKFNDWNLSKDFILKNNFKIFGGSNESISNTSRFLEPNEQLNLYKTYSKIFCLSSSPAPYTLGFIEAIMSDSEIFICKHGADWDERFSFGQDYNRVESGIYSFRANQKIRQLFSERTAKLEWIKLLG